jgi:hypothetical protein
MMMIELDSWNGEKGYIIYCLSTGDKHCLYYTSVEMKNKLQFFKPTNILLLLIIIIIKILFAETVCQNSTPECKKYTPCVRKNVSPSTFTTTKNCKVLSKHHYDIESSRSASSSF